MNELEKWIFVAAFIAGFMSTAYALEALGETKGGRRWLALILGSMVLLAVALFALQASARDLDGRYANSPHKQWFDQLKSKGGAPCCSDADGSAVSDADWRSSAGGYEVYLEGAWHKVPDEAVVTEPNRVGRTMVWPIYNRGLGGVLSITIRCFMPGPMT